MEWMNEKYEDCLSAYAISITGEFPKTKFEFLHHFKIKITQIFTGYEECSGLSIIISSVKLKQFG